MTHTETLLSSSLAGGVCWRPLAPQEWSPAGSRWWCSSLEDMLNSDKCTFHYQFFWQILMIIGQ